MNADKEVSKSLMIAGGDFAGEGDFSGSVDPDFGIGVIET
jgi:hypothetical protein